MGNGPCPPSGAGSIILVSVIRVPLGQSHWVALAEGTDPDY